MNEDYLRNNIFLSHKYKMLFNTIIRNHIIRVVELFKSENLNMYVTGSISRGEPSFKYDHKHSMFHLNSDIDFILLTNDSDKINRENILNKVDYLSKNSEYRDSIILVDKKSINKFKSCLGKDFELSMGDELIKNFCVTKSNTIKISCEEKFDCITYQVMNFYFNKRSEYSHVKLILECLRMQLYNTGFENICYYDVYSCRKSDCLTGLLSSIEIEQVLKSREMLGLFQLPNIELEALLRKSIGGIFGYNLNTFSQKNLFELISFRVKNVNSFIGLYQCGVILLAFFIETNNIFENVFYDECVICLYKLLGLHYKFDILGEIIFPPEKSTDKCKKTKSLLEIFKLMFSRYVEDLTIKDTGENGYLL